MRPAVTLLGCLLVLGAGDLWAQTPKTSTPNLPMPKAMQDTIVISTFQLQPTPSPNYNLKATFLGLAPAAYRVSVFDDFRDRPSFLTWPTSNVPTFNTSQTSGTCGQNSVKIAAFFQVQARKKNGQRVNSGVSRDTVCITFG